MKLNIKQCELLDKILYAFGEGEHLDKKTILEIFNNDENEASLYINILSQLKLVRKIGEIEGSKLGLLFYKEDQSEVFMAEGSFVERHKEKEKELNEINEFKILEKKNLELQNNAFIYEETIRDQEARIRSLDEKLKKFEVLKNFEWLIRLGIGVVFSLATWWLTRF